MRINSEKKAKQMFILIIFISLSLCISHITKKYWLIISNCVLHYACVWQDFENAQRGLSDTEQLCIDTMVSFSVWASMEPGRHILHKNGLLCSRVGNSEYINFIFEILVLRDGP